MLIRFIKRIYLLLYLFIYLFMINHPFFCLAWKVRWFFQRSSWLCKGISESFKHNLNTFVASNTFTAGLQIHGTAALMLSAYCTLWTHLTGPCYWRLFVSPATFVSTTKTRSSLHTPIKHSRSSHERNMIIYSKNRRSATWWFIAGVVTRN